MTLHTQPSPVDTDPAEDQPRTSGAHRRRTPTPRLRVPAAVSSLALVLYAALALLQHWQREGNWDSAVLGQAVAGYADLSAPVADTLGAGANQLGDHFSPMLAVLAPAYQLWPHTLTLQLAQVLLLAASVLVVTRAGVRHLGELAGGCLGLAYALSFGLQSAVHQGFHELAFAALLIALVGDRYLAGRYTAAAWTAVPLLLVKEDLGFVVGALGVVLFLKGARAAGLWLIGVAVVYLPVVLLLVIPSLNQRDQYDFAALAVDRSDGTVAGVSTLLLDMSDPVRWVAAFLALAVTAFLCCRSPFLLLAVPILLERVAAPWPYYWGPFGHYNLPVMTIVFVAAIEGAVLLRRSGHARLRQLGRHGPVVTLAAAVGLLPAFALGDLATGSSWSRTDEAAAIAALTEQIEPGSSVQADRSLASFLFADFSTTTLELPGAPRETGGTEATDYIAIDSRVWAAESVDPVDHALAQHPEVAYEVVFDQSGIILLARTDP